jgi:hypothetical protein
MPGATGRLPAAVLFDLYDTLVHASPRRSFYHAVPAALGVTQERWLACYRALGRAAMLGDVPDLTTRVGLACRHAGQPRDLGLPHTESARADADVCCADLAEAGRVLLGQEERP